MDHASMEERAKEEEAVPEAVIDMALPGWPALAAAQLRARRFARLRLTPAEAELTRRLYAATSAFYDDDAKHAVAVSDRQLGALNDRSGYIPSKRREMYELHGRSGAPRVDPWTLLSPAPAPAPTLAPSLTQSGPGPHPEARP